MGNYSVPESICQYKPKGTMVKRISDHYYVYEYSNNIFACNSGISSLDFGEYAVTMANSQKTLTMLKECFNPQDAVTIYTAAMIHFIQGFTYLRDIHSYYGMSILSIRYHSSRQKPEHL